jgi:hypothetical protein
MVRTPDQCPVCVHLKESHPRLVPLMQELRELLAEADPVCRHLEMAAASLFEVVTQQFDREQRAHLFQHVVERDPELAECAELRHAEHLRLVEKMEQIRAAFDRRRGLRDQGVDGYLTFMLEDFLMAWNEHERKEDQLVRDAMQAEPQQVS